MPLATYWGRTGVRNVADAQSSADSLISVRVGLSAASTAGNAAQKHIIRGNFEMLQAIIYISTALHASAKTVSIGTDATAARFASVAGSAGAGNERTIVTPGSAAVPDWQSTGTANAVTTVVAFITDVSGVVGNGAVTLTYVMRS